MINRANARKLAQAVGWLAQQPEDFQASVLEVTELRRFDPGDFAFRLADEGGAIYGLVEGSFGVMIENPVEGVILAHVIHPGVWFGEGPMLTGRPRTLSFRALEPSTLLAVAPSAIQSVLRRVSDAGRLLGSLGTFNTAIAIEAMSDLLIRQSDRRIAAVLLRSTAGSFEANVGDGRVLNLTQADVSQMANVSRHVVNATLRDLAAKGWVETGYGRLVIRNRAALAAFVTEDRPLTTPPPASPAAATSGRLP